MAADEDGAHGNKENKPEEIPPAKKRKVKKLVLPRRQPSIVVPPRNVVFITPDKTTCEFCTCFPKEDPYVKNKKLNECQKSPLTLYELAADAVDRLPLPDALQWSVEEVAQWMADQVGLPQYMDCIRENHIDGMRLLMLEDPSHLPEINIRQFTHIKAITSQVRNLYGVEFVLFSRSIGLPPRLPPTHCTWFKSRTGPNWGIRRNWTRCDILRWMKILMPEPLHLNHWDLVWYHKPDFPKVKFARIPKRESDNYIPIYKPKKEISNEYLTPRRFKIDTCIDEAHQLIWMEKRPPPKEKKVKTKKEERKKDMPQMIESNMRGKDLLLMRRKMPTKKFLAF